jgi:hypothetical protein
VTGPVDGRGSGNVVISYWFPQTTNARRTITIGYTAQGALAYYAGGDQLRWTALPADRPYAVDSSTITLRLPSATDQWRVDAYPRVLLDERQPMQAQGAVATWRAAGIGPGQPLDVRAQWPHGMVAGSPPSWQAAADEADRRRESVGPVLTVAFGLAGLLVLVGGLAMVVVRWFAHGRDPAIGSVPPEIDEPPSDLPPALVGVVTDERADVQDVVATVLDLAARGVVRITEVVDRRLVPTQRDFELELVDQGAVIHDFERQVLDSLFARGSPARLSQLGDWFGTQVPRLQQSLTGAAYRQGLFAADPEVVRRRYQRLGTLLIVLGAALGFVACVVPAASYGAVVTWPFLGLVVVGAVLRFASGSMPRRTAGGALEAARWRAYARHLQRVGPAAWSAPDGQNGQTGASGRSGRVPAAGRAGDDGERAAELVERTLPYAVALGVDRAWVQKFASVGAPPPRWMQPPVIVVGGAPWGTPMGGPWVGPLGPGAPWGGPHHGHWRGRPSPGPGGAPGSASSAPPAGQDAAGSGPEGWSNSLADLINAASEVMGRGGSGGWSGGGAGGGSFGGGGHGGGGGGSSFG